VAQSDEYIKREASRENERKRQQYERRKQLENGYDVQIAAKMNHVADKEKANTSIVELGSYYKQQVENLVVADL